jgi:hypothetical protein
VSIIRVGLAETRKFADGYDAIFGKKTAGEPRTANESAGKQPAPKKKKEKKAKRK